MRRAFLLAKVLVISLAISVLVSACAPVARVIADGIEDADGASLVYVLDTDPRGVRFDAGERLARGVIVTLEGDTLQLVQVPEGVVCEVVRARADCRLGDVQVGAAVFLGVSGSNVSGLATFRREGASRVHLVFARFSDLVVPVGGGE